jgi:glycosyltransferase involved in cell wall biosynthesis
MGDVAVIILTHNEALHIARAIESVRPFAREIFVVDSHSTDDTVAIARRLGATVLQNAWTNYAIQFTWALANAPITSNWIMRLDADEVVGEDLAAEINATLPTLGKNIVGLTVDRRHIFLDRWIRHGGRFPLTLLRIWRKGFGRIEARWMDEHIIVWGGSTLKLKGAFFDWNLKDITFFTAKHNSYSVREALDILIEKYELLSTDNELTSQGSSDQASMKRVVKQRIYNKMPFWLSTPLYFIFRYFIQLGFLDGLPGVIYHVLQGFWYRFLVGAKVCEYERAMAGATTRRERVEILSRMTGYELGPGPDS